MLRKIKDRKNIIMVLFGMAFLMMVINMTDVTKTSALFVEEQEPVLVYNETLNKIEKGKFELVEDSLQKKEDKIVFQVQMGRNIVSDKVPEDYFLHFDESKCSVKIKRNGKSYSNITYPKGSSDYNDNILYFECDNDESIEEVSFNITVNEAINGILFNNTRELNVVYVNEMRPPVDYDTLVEKIQEYLIANSNRENITLDDVNGYVASKGVTEENPDYSLIPGIDDINTFQFNQALRDDFEKYMFKGEYNVTFPGTVGYINKALQNSNSPLSKHFERPSDEKEVSYYVYYEAIDSFSVIQVDELNTIKVFNINDIIKQIDEILVLYIPIDDLENKTVILENLKDYLIHFGISHEDTNPDDSITIYFFRTSEEDSGVSNPGGDDVGVNGPTGDEVVNNKETEYREFLNQLNGDFNNTETFIQGLELNEENPFYQYFINESDDVANLYYVYYELESNDEQFVALSEEVNIKHLTLIEMNKEKIQVSKLDSTNLIEILKADNKINIYTKNDEGSFISSVLEGLLQEMKFASTDYEVENVDENKITFTILTDYKEVSDDSDISGTDDENSDLVEDNKGDVDGSTDGVDDDSLASDGNDESDAFDEVISSEDSVIDGNIGADDVGVNNGDDTSSIENFDSLNNGGSSLDFSNLDNGSLLAIS